MTRLESPIGRLEQAISRLDAALQSRADAARAERAKHAALKEATEKVSARLDSAIGRLKTVLET